MEVRILFPVQHGDVVTIDATVIGWLRLDHFDCGAHGGIGIRIEGTRPGSSPGALTCVVIPGGMTDPGMQ